MKKLQEACVAQRRTSQNQSVERFDVSGVPSYVGDARGHHLQSARDNSLHEETGLADFSDADPDFWRSPRNSTTRTTDSKTESCRVKINPLHRWKENSLGQKRRIADRSVVESQKVFLTQGEIASMKNRAPDLQFSLATTERVLQCSLNHDKFLQQKLQWTKSGTNDKNNDHCVSFFPPTRATLPVCI